MRMLIILAVLSGVTICTTAGSNANEDAPADIDLAAEKSRRALDDPHDFSDIEGNPAGSCKACHIPHVEAARPTTQPTTQPAMEMYRVAGQRRVFIPDRYMPGATSLICLGCHDGTVAPSTIGSSHALRALAQAGFRMPEGVAWRDHPIGIPYPAGDREYRPQAFVVADGKMRLPEGRVECITCHDPHGTQGFDKLLVMSNRRSALCLVCHVK